MQKSHNVTRCIDTMNWYSLRNIHSIFPLNSEYRCNFLEFKILFKVFLPFLKVSSLFTSFYNTYHRQRLTLGYFQHECLVRAQPKRDVSFSDILI